MSDISETTDAGNEISDEARGLCWDEDTLGDIADLFKIFADSTRIKILYALFDSELNVTRISEMVEMNQSAVSHQLRILKQSRLIRVRRDGKNMYYSLADEHVRTILNMGVEHISE
ncbi:MAG: metalloregulator ArsR/SmtB family transcription factor [Clostridiales bacterium]|nr:metalloregulator ArsR/SmtB family transcription factor [Clostridiales bacterium]